jgi:hypothetical protein
MKKEYKLSEESAREQMQSLMDSYDINQKDLVVDQGPEAIESIMNRLVRAIRTGQIEVQENGSVLHNLVVTKGEVSSLTYRRADGIALREASKAKGGADERQVALMASLCNMPVSAIWDLDIRDISIVQRLGTLFMVA